VLLVEDDRFTASFAANILNKDYDLVHSKTGEDAIIAYVEHAPDIVLLDIHLPGLNGHETLRAIKKADGDAAIIMLSVDTVKQNIVGAAQGGAITFLKKPFSKDRLLAAILKSPHIKGSKAARPRS
jgi:DNA-binding response OmpR family regulator